MMITGDADYVHLYFQDNTVGTVIEKETKGTE